MRRIVLVLLLSALPLQADEVARMHELVERARAIKWTRTPPPTPADFKPAAAKTFNVTARQWSYTFSPTPFVVDAGDSVTLNISVPSNDQSSHGFFLEGHMEDGIVIDRGRTQTVNFIAPEAGTFIFLCTFECGIGHTSMNGRLTVREVVPSPPGITSFTPISGPTAGGTIVAITGTGFQTGATVKFGETNAVTSTVNGPTSITTTNPARAAGPVSITVTNPDGQSATSTTQFTYETPSPTVASFTPATGSTSGGTVVAITGTNFQTAATVKFGNVGATSTTVNSATSISATSPAQVAGPVTIAVTNPDGKSGTSAGAFTYVAPPPPPAINSFTPSTGPAVGGTWITITGSNFASIAAVRFGAAGAVAVTVVNATTIRALSPPLPAGQVSIMVLNADGQSATAASMFMYTGESAPKPKIRRSVRR
jgi:plastocyanin